MLSGEWKLPKIKNLIKTIRLNPDDEQEEDNCVHIKFGAKKGLSQLM